MIPTILVLRRSTFFGWAIGAVMALASCAALSAQARPHIWFAPIDPIVRPG
jgi:hypothetical protein